MLLTGAGWSLHDRHAFSVIIPVEKRFSGLLTGGLLKVIKKVQRFKGSVGS